MQHTGLIGKPCLTGIFYIAAITAAHAESLEEIAARAHLANINALLVFTSQEGLSTGRYSFTNVGVDMEVYKLPFTYHFESEEKAVDYFMVGNVGYSRVFISQEIELPPASRLDYDNHLRTYTAGLGGGIRYKATDEIHFSAGIEFIYSRSGASVKQPDDDLGEIIEDFFNQNYNDNITYNLFTIAEYRAVIDDYKPYAKISYSLYETSSVFSFEELLTFNTQSSVTMFSIGVETPGLMEKNGNSLTLETYINGNYLAGDIVPSVKFDTYGTLGVIVYWYTPKDPWWAERFFIEASTVHASGLDGYNLGVGFTVNF